MLKELMKLFSHEIRTVSQNRVYRVE